MPVVIVAAKARTTVVAGMLRARALSGLAHRQYSAEHGSQPGTEARL
jgi:hypothetical protein